MEDAPSGRGWHQPLELSHSHSWLREGVALEKVCRIVPKSHNVWGQAEQYTEHCQTLALQITVYERQILIRMNRIYSFFMHMLYVLYIALSNIYMLIMLTSIIWHLKESCFKIDLLWTNLWGWQWKYVDTSKQQQLLMKNIFSFLDCQLRDKYVYFISFIPFAK